MNDEFDCAYASLAADVVTAIDMEAAIAGRGPAKKPRTRGRANGAAGSKQCVGKGVLHPSKTRSTKELVHSVIKACVEERRRTPSNSGPDLSDEALSRYTRFTDKFALKPYERFLWYVPRLVNVVTVATCSNNPVTAARARARARACALTLVCSAAC